MNDAGSAGRGKDGEALYVSWVLGETSGLKMLFPISRRPLGNVGAWQNIGVKNAAFNFSETARPRNLYHLCISRLFAESQNLEPVITPNALTPQNLIEFL